ncbi:MAG TPA: hypothetical protein DD490_27260 [Acidobacteria bacterium]|nr:hypothetical protein [Acidobacteriota bacterium]
MEGNIHEPSPLETAVRRLYALPLAEFVTARNDLAKQVKGGDREAWLRVKALPKASVTAWAVNQLFAREEEKMRRLLGLGERVRRLAAEEGEGLREALEEERALRDDLRQRAAAILSEQTPEPAQALLDRVGVNLEALAYNPAAAEVAARGWLSEDLERPGFELLASLQIASRRTDRRGLRLVPPPVAPVVPFPVKAAMDPAVEEARAREEERRRARIQRAQEKVDLLAAQADALRREAERVDREAVEAEKVAQEAASRAALARQNAGRAISALRRAEEELETARRSGPPD